MELSNSFKHERSRRLRLVMLVDNACLHDSRVFRASEVAVAAGFETIILSRSADGAPAEEIRKGVLIRRLKGTTRYLSRLNPRVSRHFRGLSDLSRAWRSIFQISSEVSALKELFGPELRRLAPDFIHAHDLATLPAATAEAASLGSRVIYDCHELESHRVGLIDRLLRRAIEKRHIYEAHAVVTVCDSIASYLADRYRIATPVVVMNSGPLEYDAQESDIRSDLGLPAEAPLAVYIGKLTTGRGLEQTITSLKYWSDLHLALIGPTRERTVRLLQRMVGTLGVPDRVHFVAPMAPEKVSTYVASADLSVVPIQNSCLSYYYSLPNKLVESTMARLPIVVSNFPELRRFVEVSRSGLVMDETDPEDIARAMRDAYAERDALRPDQDCLRRVESVYGWPRQKQALLDLYDEQRLSFEDGPGNSSNLNRQSA